jgi:YggT family protein
VRAPGVAGRQERDRMSLVAFKIIYLILDIFSWIIIAGAIMSWLVAFGVVNTRNQFVRMLVDLLYRLTEPVLRPVRRLLPNLGGIDISPVIVLIAIFIVKDIILPAVFF